MKREPNFAHSEVKVLDISLLQAGRCCCELAAGTSAELAA
jgi:hypothetical protein